MDSVQLVVKTVVTTLDVAILIASVKALDKSAVKAAAVFAVINLMGVWI